MKLKKYRTVWLSDIHLGTRSCKAEQLLSFLKSIGYPDTIYLVGDIIDFWVINRKHKWSNKHSAVIQQLLKMVNHGSKLIFIPGNHDEILRSYVGLKMGGIEIHEEFTHECLNGLKIHCLHGDKFDIITKYHKWIAVLGDMGYSFLLQLNEIIHSIRTRLGRTSHWSISAVIKMKVKDAVNFISDYEDTIIRYAKSINVDAILCGHIHHAQIKQCGDILYLNTGDWVESLTAIVEKLDGKLELIHYEEKTADNL